MRNLTLETAKDHIGDLVIYIPWKDAPKDTWEKGVITSVSNKYVFVRYGLGSTSASTNPSDLYI